MNFLSQPPVLAQNDSVTLVTSNGVTNVLKITDDGKRWNSYVDGKETGWESDELRVAILGGLLAIGMEWNEAQKVIPKIMDLLAAQTEKDVVH